jgi:hypothetical protein
MPKELERALKKSAVARGMKPGTPRYGAYVYGSLRQLEHEKKPKKKLTKTTVSKTTVKGRRAQSRGKRK